MTAAENTSAEPPAFPERVGRYELLLPIGTGGMATVYLARTLVVEDLFREVALKLMHPQLRADEGQSAVALISEAKLAGSIRHPNVVPVLEVGEEAAGIYLVMDYVEGDTLSGLLRGAKAAGEPVPIPIVGRILTDALTGLHAAHELRDPAGISLQLVHRDFSPQNILVGVDGIARLTDFGIAKVAAGSGATATGVIKGKIGYVSPEQAMCKALDRRCDVWAAGVVTWELLATRRLYDQEDQVGTLLQIISHTPPRLRSVRPELPAELDDVISGALVLERDRRWPSALAFRDRLVSAWRSMGGLADTIEVGEYVQAVTKLKLEKRRRRIARVLKLRQQMARVSRSAIAGVQAENLTPSAGFEPSQDLYSLSSGTANEPVAQQMDGVSGQTAPTGDLSTQGTSLSQRFRPPWRKRRFIRRGAVVFGAVGVVGLGTWGVVAALPDSSGEEAPLPATSVGAHATPPAASTGVVEATPAPNLALMVKANAPMTSLGIGDRTVALAAPAERVEVMLSDQERLKGVKLQAVSVDGRRVIAQIAPAAKSVDIKFPKKPRVRPPRWAGSPPPKPKPGETSPGLAPTPYEK